MKKRNKLSLLLIFVLILSGCQLAKEENQVSQGRFIGIYLRSDRMGLLEAHEVPEVIYDEETETYDVKDDKGYFYFSPTVIKKDGERYMEQVSSGHLSDIRTTVSVGEGSGTAADVEATLFFTERNQIFYPYRIYQDGSGKVYLERSDMGYQLDHMGALMFSEEASYDEIRNIEGYQMKLKVTFEYKAVPETIRIFEMGEDHKVRNEVVFEASETVPSYEPGEDTAYLLVEYISAEAGENTVERLLLSEKDQSLPLYEAGDGVLKKHLVPLQWIK